MLNCDMAGVIAAMRGTPRPRNHTVRTASSVSVPQMSPEDMQAWNSHFSHLADMNQWRDTW